MMKEVIIREMAQTKGIGNPMKFPRHQLLHAAADAVALPPVSCIAAAQTYPTRPIMMVVGS
jgi:hypothetical protein